MMKACAENRRRTSNGFWFKEKTNAGDTPGCLKSCGETYNEQETAMASVVAPYSAKIWNAATILLFFTNLSLEFLLFSALGHNQNSLACKHWWRWVRRTNSNPSRSTMLCISSDTILGIPLFFLHFGEQPKLEKMEKPKWESLLCSACWNEFGGDGEESGCGPFLMIRTQNIRLRIR